MSDAKVTTQNDNQEKHQWGKGLLFQKDGDSKSHDLDSFFLLRLLLFSKMGFRDGTRNLGTC